MLITEACVSDLNNPLYRFVLFLVLFEVTWQLVVPQSATATIKVFAILTETLKVQEDATSHLTCSH